MNRRLTRVDRLSGRAVYGLIAAAFLIAMPGAVPSSLGDCPHHRAHQDQQDASHDVAGHDAEPNKSTPTPCTCIGSCQGSRPIALPGGDSDRYSYDRCIDIEIEESSTPVLTLVSYHLPYAHGPPEQL